MKNNFYNEKGKIYQNDDEDEDENNGLNSNMVVARYKVYST